jgi:hypothetical protein
MSSKNVKHGSGIFSWKKNTPKEGIQKTTSNMNKGLDKMSGMVKSVLLKGIQSMKQSKNVTIPKDVLDKLTKIEKGLEKASDTETLNQLQQEYEALMPELTKVAATQKKPNGKKQANAKLQGNSGQACSSDIQAVRSDLDDVKRGVEKIETILNAVMAGPGGQQSATYPAIPAAQQAQVAQVAQVAPQPQGKQVVAQQVAAPAAQQVAAPAATKGGSRKVKYHNRLYTVRTGSTGGKYILVKGNKVYV